MFIHEDARRTLIEWSGGRVSKALIAKSSCTVGDHFHRNKEEKFLLLTGRAYVTIGDAQPEYVEAPSEFTVPPNTYHAFNLADGSILLGVCSEEFDPKDEIKGHP